MGNAWQDWYPKVFEYKERKPLQSSFEEQVESNNPGDLSVILTCPTTEQCNTAVKIPQKSQSFWRSPFTFLHPPFLIFRHDTHFAVISHSCCRTPRSQRYSMFTWWFRLTNVTNAFMIGLFGGCAKSYTAVTRKGRCILNLNHCWAMLGSTSTPTEKVGK